MASQRVNGPSKERAPRRRPGTTPEARENQLIAGAVDLAEKQIRDGTASAQVITHFLKLGSTREHLEQQLLEQTIELKKAQRENMASAARVEELYTSAIQAMRSYAGQRVPVDDEDYD